VSGGRFIHRLPDADTKDGMNIIRHIHVRAALVAIVGIVAVGGGAAYAATRSTTRPLGTGVVVINTTLSYQSGSAAGTGMVLTSSGEVLANNSCRTHRT
jgi:hypothetical protein